MKQFRLVDNILGWLTFFIAAFVYCSTIEPTASFWDCPEFITTGYKMEIGHPPGAPFFMLTANLFSQFTSDPTHVAYMVNMMNALLSAACILFLFWSITHLVRRLLIDRWEELDLNKMLIIEASGLVGALIYTFSDTFWYSAVEGEVYAYSSAFTAVVFWLILKWEDHADEPHSDRWLILIMYLMGLSIGVHLLNLLCLPAIVLVYYYKRFPNANLKGSLVALLVSFVILAAVLYGVVPGIITVGGWFELFFVNSLHMPFNSGLIIYIILLVASVLWAIYETQMATEKNWKRQNIAFLLGFGLLGVPFYGWGWSAFITGIVVLAVVGWLLFWRKRNKESKSLIPIISARLKNTTLLCMLMLMIGYSTYAVIVIRSSANPPMDQNSPEDIFTLGDYLSREQYGYRPLMWGQTFASEIKFGEPDEEGLRKPDKTYEGVEYKRKEKASADEPDTYIPVEEEKRQKVRYIYHQNMFFPRMYSSDHTAQYKSWLELPKDDTEWGQRVPSQNGEGDITIPTFWENMKFFFSYQVNFMYWRYFLWNFAGRQNDIQGHGEMEHGNWLSGIPALDNARLGNQDLLPDVLKNNKGHNVYYCLPLLLGIIGLFWQMLRRGQKGIKQFWVVFFLFFMTGMAIVLYLNQTPSQPRERDYAYAGSFYAYAIWCGMGVAAIATMLNKYLKKYQTVLSAVVSVACLLVPIQMASQNWDDHDRSGRYTCRDFGRNYLMSLQDEGCPIIFTNGDNDTFPLWYNQDTEGERTDVRVCNLSYLQTDWYTDQMMRPAYDSPGSPAVPISFTPYQYNNMPNYFVIDPNIGFAIEKLYQMYPKEQIDEIFGEDPFELHNIMKYWVRNERTEAQREKQKKALKLILNQYSKEGEYPIDLNVIPTDIVYLNINKQDVMESGISIPGINMDELKDLPEAERDSIITEIIPDRIAINIGKRLDGATNRYLGRSQIMMLEMVANANWKRPLYVAMTVGYDQYPGLHEYMAQEGLTYRITPFKTRRAVNTEKTYDRVMKHFRFGGVKTKGIYLDETVMRMCLTHRFLLTDLAQKLLEEGKEDKARDILNLIERELPAYNVTYDFDTGASEYGNPEQGLARQYHAWVRSSALDMARIYIPLGETKKALDICNEAWKQARQYVNYYYDMELNMFLKNEGSCVKQFAVMLDVLKTLNMANLKEEYNKKCDELLKLMKTFIAEKGGTFHKEFFENKTDERTKQQMRIYHYTEYGGMVLDTSALNWDDSRVYGYEEEEEEWTDEELEELLSENDPE